MELIIPSVVYALFAPQRHQKWSTGEDDPRNSSAVARPRGRRDRRPLGDILAPEDKPNGQCKLPAAKQKGKGGLGKLNW